MYIYLLLSLFFKCKSMYGAQKKLYFSSGAREEVTEPPT
jgi:hypothetical protein